MKATELASLLNQRAEKYGDFHVVFVMTEKGKHLQRIVSEVNVLDIRLPKDIDKEQKRTERAIILS
jgi:hypothetical protein